MATPAYHTAPSATRRRKPDPARVVQSYQHQVEALGKRGALRRTAALYGISDETVRRYVLAAEQPKAPAATVAQVPPYEPPPGGYPEPAPARHDISLPHTTPQRAAVATCGNAAGGDPLLAEIERGIMSNVPYGRNATAFATRHTAERDDVADETPQPGHARPDINNPDSEMPELPPESFPDPSPNQPDTTPAVEPGSQRPPPVPMERPPDPDPDWLPPTQAVPIVRVVRVPVEQPAGIVGWLAEHEAARKQLLGLVVLLLLIGLSWLG